jgi:hypothetical protein
MSDETDSFGYANFAVMVVVAAIVGVVVFGAMGATGTLDDMREYSAQAETWCETENGTLYNSHTLGDHSGLHCGMGDSVVHMDTVAELNWTHNVSKVKAHDNPSVFPSLGEVGIALGIVLSIVVTVYIVGRVRN